MDIFDKVIYIGPDIDAKGGIASVLKSYKEHFPTFHYLKTNSRHGTIPGLFNLLWVFIALPIVRIFTCRNILHIHVATGKSFIRKSWIITWGKILGYKIIFHNHGAETKEYYAKRGISVIKKTLDKCDSIVVLSNTWKEYYESTFGYYNVTIINNIVSHAENGLPIQHHDKIRFIFLGLIGYRKGIFDLIEVMYKHKEFLEDKIELAIGGNGEIDKLNSLIENFKLHNFVKYIGWISGNKKFRLLANSDVLILPSYNEGLPISLLEAMAYGKATISTSIGGIPSIIHNGYNGFLTEPGDKKAIFNAIKHYINNPNDIITHGQKALNIVKSFYPEEVSLQLQKLYNSIN